MKTKLLQIMILLSALLLSGCSLLQKTVKTPTAKVEKVEIKALSFKDAKLEMMTNITNPNPFGVTIAGFEYKLIVSDQVVISGTSDIKQTIAKNSSSTVVVPLDLEFAKVFATATELLTASEIEYKIEAVVKFDLAILKKSPLKISHKGKLEIPKLPKLKVASIKLKNLSLTTIELDIKVKIENLNSFGLIFEKLGYAFKVDGKPWVESSNKPSQKIAPKSDTTIDLSSKLNFLDIGAGFYNQIRGKKPLNTSFDADFELAPDHPLLEKIKLPLSDKSELKL